MNPSRPGDLKEAFNVCELHDETQVSDTTDRNMYQEFKLPPDILDWQLFWQNLVMNYFLMLEILALNKRMHLLLCGATSVGEHKRILLLVLSTKLIM